jgi:hypothetical protein
MLESAILHVVYTTLSKAKLHRYLDRLVYEASRANIARGNSGANIAS